MGRLFLAYTLKMRLVICLFILFCTSVAKVYAEPADPYLQIAQALVAYAYRHDMPVNSDLIVALDESTNDDKTNRPIQRNSVLAERTRDLITQLDETLSESDAEFKRLFRSYKAEEDNLQARTHR